MKLVVFSLLNSRVICLQSIYHGDVIIQHISDTSLVKYISIIMCACASCALFACVCTCVTEMWKTLLYLYQQHWNQNPYSTLWPWSFNFGSISFSVTGGGSSLSEGSKWHFLWYTTVAYTCQLCVTDPSLGHYRSRVNSPHKRLVM